MKDQGLIEPVSPILNREDTDVTFVYDAVTIRTMTQIRNRDDSISSLNVCWDLSAFSMKLCTNVDYMHILFFRVITSQ